MTTETSPSDTNSSLTQAELPAVASVGHSDLPALLEALLLVSPHPAQLRDLANAAGVSVSDIEEALSHLGQDSSRGWVVIQHRGTAHLSSAPRFAPFVRRFLGLDRETRLSGAALETLALIAYKQPVTRAEVEALRGVDCSGVLATLHARELIEVAGRLPTVGNPNQYVTSIEFLKQFGLRSLADLPSLGEIAGGASDRVFEDILATSRFEQSDAPDDETSI
jgi:segregation and condensation protein B